MPKYTLTIVDTAGIQPYLFSTNNIRQNSGASFLVDCATRGWVQDVLTDVVGNAEKHNIRNINAKDDIFYEDRFIQNEHIWAEVIYAGGGNTVILFDDQKLAHRFTQQLTKKVMIKAPGLRVAVQHEHFLWDEDALGGENGLVAQTIRKLSTHKRSVLPTPALMGLGVSSECVFTDLPACGYDQDGRPVSSESQAKDENEFDEKNDKSETADTRLRDLINFKEYRPARRFEDLGATHDDSSYIAVVHADGNGMGNRVKGIQHQYETAADNRAYIKAMRNFSSSMRVAALEALQETVNYLIDNIKPPKKGTGEKHTIGDIELKRSHGELRLPFRPLVFGGDDVTFVCDGRLGLELAAHYLQRFSSKTLSDGKEAHCRAGIAIVPSHYPFAHAYKLAEDLCASAKSAIPDWESNPRRTESGVTVMDWHFAVGGMVDHLSNVRAREYTSDSGLRQGSRPGDMLMRPIRLSDPRIDWHNWETFQKLVSTFKSGTEWKEKRNKVMALREALRRGPEAVEVFRYSFLDHKLLPTIGREQNMMSEGWQGNECGYFDAIEAIDFYLELDKLPSEQEIKE